jgi:hypothetical protein
MALALPGPATAAAAWATSERLPDRVAATCLYDSAGWLRAWERVALERRTRHAYVTTAAPAGASAVLPLYEVVLSPFWAGYEAQCGLLGRFGGPVVFAGSPYSMYAKRGTVDAPLAIGAHATAMAWIAEGPGEVLVAPNVTAAGVRDWVSAAGPPVGTVLLERTYSADLPEDFADYLARLPSKLRRDVERRLRRSRERGLRVGVVEGPQARALVPAAHRLTTGASAKNDWPALFDEAALERLLDVPGALLATAYAEDRLLGAFLGFRSGTEITFMCGGVDYASLPEWSTYVALVYRLTEWACEQGIRRIEWGRDNYRFKERHRLVGTDLWALVYAPGARRDLAGALDRMHRVLSAHIEGA